MDEEDAIRQLYPDDDEEQLKKKIDKVNKLKQEKQALMNAEANSQFDSLLGQFK